MVQEEWASAELGHPSHACDVGHCLCLRASLDGQAFPDVTKHTCPPIVRPWDPWAKHGRFQPILMPSEISFHGGDKQENATCGQGGSCHAINDSFKDPQRKHVSAFQTQTLPLAALVLFLPMECAFVHIDLVSTAPNA